MGLIIDGIIFLILLFILSLPTMILYVIFYGFNALVDEFRGYGDIERRNENRRRINERDAENYLANSVFWSDMGNH